MKISIGIHGGGDQSDVTPYIDTKQDVTLTQERERDAFQIVTSDLKLRLSNLRGQFFPAFLDPPAGTMWDVKAIADRSDGTDAASRVLFTGILGTQVGAYNADTIVFNMAQQKVDIQAYSADKLFWRAAQGYAVRRSLIPGDDGSQEYFTVAQVLRRETGNGRFSGIVSQIDAGVYATRQIAAWKRATDQQHWNPSWVGASYADLDPTTTVEVLLNAMARYYNAVFFVEPGTGTLMMRPRTGVVNDLQIDISNSVAAANIGVSLSDSRQIDYISIPAPTLPVPQVDKSLCNWTWVSSQGSGNSYQIAAVYYGYVGGAVIESDLSETIDVPFPVDAGGILQGQYFLLPKPPQAPGDPAIAGVRIYAGDAKTDRWSLIFEAGSLPFIDYGNNDEYINLSMGGTWSAMSMPGLVYVPMPFTGSPYSGGGTVTLYISYAEGEGWTVTRSDATDVQPIGVGINLLPNLKFAQLDGTPIKNLSELVSFFGNEMTAFAVVTGFFDPYKDLFVPKRKLSITAEGLNYMLGDSVVINRVFDPAARGLIGKYWIKKAVQHMMKQETELEIVQV